MRFLLLVLLVSLYFPLSAQSTEERRELFDDGEYFLVREEFEEAAYNFRKLTDTDPKNSHYNFKLGECYMNIPGKEHLAIPCFEVAVKRTVDKKKYRARDFNETNAPLHAMFYLGNVYRMNGRLNDALKTYDGFVNSPLYYGNYNINVVENEIKSCERAKVIMDSPVDAQIVPVDTSINTPASEIHPVASSDGNTLVFVRKLKFYDAILSVTWDGTVWSQPVNLNPMIGSDGDFYPVSLSNDGNALYLVKAGQEDKDLYVSYRNNNLWGKAVSLGKWINSPFDETWASESADGRFLWITSSRKGGQGGLDIYYSQRNQNNTWSKPKNAGKVINTPFDEESPFLSKNDSILFFSSKGHSSIGGYDIFFAVRSGKSWNAPVNIGYPVNNTHDNMGFVPGSNGRSGYYSFINIKEPGSSEDIYRITLGSDYPLR